VAQCTVWDTDHCFADGTVAWVVKRTKNKRTAAAATAAKEAAQRRAPAAQEDANRSFADASAAQPRQPPSGNEDNEGNSRNKDHTIEDEDTEETFSTYEPFHYKRGQVRSLPASACWRWRVSGHRIR
jgi:hypothetical protein